MFVWGCSLATWLLTQTALASTVTAYLLAKDDGMPASLKKLTQNATPTKDKQYHNKRMIPFRAHRIQFVYPDILIYLLMVLQSIVFWNTAG